MEPDEILQQPEMQEHQQHAASSLGDVVSDVVDGGADLMDVVSEVDVSGLAEGAAEAAGGALEVIGGLLGSIFD